MTHQSLALLAQPTGRLEGMCCAWEGNLIFQFILLVIKNPQTTTKPTSVAANKRHVGHTWQLNTTAYSGCTGWFVHSFFPWNKLINRLSLCVAATGRSLGTLARVETWSRGWRGSWCRARWRVSVCTRSSLGTRAPFIKPLAGASGTRHRVPEGSQTKPVTQEPGWVTNRPVLCCGRSC